MPKSALCCALALAAAAPLGAQAPLTLADAFRRADSAAYANRIAGGDARARSAQATAALQGILPTVRAEAGWVRTNDPLGAFGFTLQQRGVSMASFDPANLNDPSAVTNWKGGLVAELPIINLDAWYGRAAAARSAAAAKAGTGWTRETTRVDVARAYFGAVLARDQVHTLEAASAAAQAHVRQAQSMVTNGVATRSDALLASVQAGQVEAQLIGARGSAAVARERLAMLLGQPGDTAFTLPDSLPSADQVRGLAALPVDDSLPVRLDVTAARLGAQAARRDVSRANAVYLPRINGVGRYDWNSPSRLFGGRRSYTVGVMASWTPFAGASDLAGREAAQGRAEAAQALAEAAEAGAALEQAATRIQLSVALAQLGIAEVSVDQGIEAHRIVTRKYAGGLATVAELLSAAALETQTRLGLADARYQAIVADAAARQAAGTDLMALTILEN
ncbi:MAG: TolC family protein [Gemmatimonadota bacterium]